MPRNWIFSIDNSELDDKNYEKYYYSTERIILAVPKSFPINEELTQYQLTAEDIRAGRHSQAEFPVLPLPLLKSTPFIFVKEENSIYKRSMKMCSRQNYSPNIIMKPDQVVSAFNMAGRGVGATFIPDGLIVNLPYEVPLCFYKMNEELAVRYVYLYKKRNKYLTKAMEEFIRVAVGAGHSHSQRQRHMVGHSQYGRNGHAAERHMRKAISDKGESLQHQRHAQQRRTQGNQNAHDERIADKRIVPVKGQLPTRSYGTAFPSRKQPPLRALQILSPCAEKDALADMGDKS